MLNQVFPYAQARGTGERRSNCYRLSRSLTTNYNTLMRVINCRIPLTILGLSVFCGLLLAIRIGQARSGAASIPWNELPAAAPVSQWHWQNPLPQGNNLRGASFVDASTDTVVGEHGSIVRTTDGGNSWTIQSSGTTKTQWAVSFVDANDGTAVGESGAIVATTDGGAHWVPQ